MAGDKITVTGVTGPASTETAQVFNDVQDLDFDIKSQVLRIKTALRYHELDLFTIATVTYSITTHVATVTVST